MTTSKFTTWTFGLLLLSSLILVVHLLFSFITPVIMALVIVSIFGPVHRRLLLFCGGREFLAASIATTLVFLMVMVPLTLFLLVLVQQGLTLYHATASLKEVDSISVWLQSLREYLEQWQTYLAGYNIIISPERIINFATNFSQLIGQHFYDSIGVLAANLLLLIFNFILTVALVLVFFISGRPAKIYLMDLIPIPNSEKERLVKRFHELSRAVFLGNGFISLLEGLIGGLMFYAFNVPGALIWGVAMSLAAFLPVVGATVIVIPASLYLFLLHEKWVAMVFLSINTIQLLVLETIVKPHLIGTKSQMHAFLVFLSVIAGVQIYGVLGLFYGPLLVTMFLSLTEIYKEHYRDRLLKITP